MAKRPWSTKESERAFEVLGDRIITATQRYLRSERRQRIQADIYTVAGTQLTLPQVDALETIAGAGQMRMHEVADKLGVDPSTATRTTAPLVDLGLLERSTDPGNRRYVLVRCTRAGLAAAQRFIDERRRIMRVALAPMEPQRRLLLADLLEEYLELIEHDT